MCTTRNSSLKGQVDKKVISFEINLVLTVHKCLELFLKFETIFFFVEFLGLSKIPSN